MVLSCGLLLIQWDAEYPILDWYEIFPDTTQDGLYCGANDRLCSLSTSLEEMEMGANAKTVKMIRKHIFFYLNQSLLARARER